MCVCVGGGGVGGGSFGMGLCKCYLNQGFNVALPPQRPYGYYSSSSVLLYVHRDRTDTTVPV